MSHEAQEKKQKGQKLTSRDANESLVKMLDTLETEMSTVKERRHYITTNCDKRASPTTHLITHIHAHIYVQLALKISGPF